VLITTNSQVLNVVTDAQGRVVANVTATAATAGSKVKLTALAEGVAKSETFGQFNWTAPSFTLYDLNGTSSLVRSIAKGGSNTFSFAALDQWAQPLAGDFRLQVAVSGNTVSETYPAFTAGRATVTVSDSQIADGGDITVVVTPQKLQADGTTWDTTDAPADVTYTLKPSVQTGAAVSVASTVANDFSIPVVPAALAAGDSRTTQDAVSGLGDENVDAIHLTGVVSDAITADVRGGAPITVSGPSNVLFVHGTKAAYGSLTFHAAANGSYTVAVRSNIAQKDTVITVASQDASNSTAKVTFEPALATAGRNVAVDAPVSVAPGSTLLVKVKLTDRYGNAVRNNDGAGTLQANHAVNVAYTGPGLIVGTVTNQTDANGEIELRVLLGANDRGTATVSATFKNGNAATTNDIVVQKTIIIGAAPAAEARGWTKDMGDGTIKMYARDVVGAGKIQFFHNGREVAWIRAVDATDPKLNVASDGMVRTRALVSGKNVFEIYVDGERIVRRIATGS
jgi:hypothetical protein